jgi:esterase/lipase
MFGIICDLALGKITTLDIGALVAVIGMVLMITRNNNKRLKEKADKSELEKLERDNHEQHLKIENDMKDQIKSQIDAIKEVNEEIFAQLVHISERLDYHIQTNNTKKK